MSCHDPYVCGQTWMEQRERDAQALEDELVPSLTEEETESKLRVIREIRDTLKAEVFEGAD